MISRQLDNFINNKQQWTTHWHVYLNNGEEVFDDDGRLDSQGNKLPASWIRLKEYCDKNKLWIQRMYLRFRSHYEHIPSADGYFFKKGVLGSPGMATREYFIIGTVDGDKIHVKKWKTPELIVEEENVRELKDNLEWTILKK